MFNLTDAETPMMSFGSEFTDPNLFFAMEAEQDAQGQVIAIQPATGTAPRTGHVNGVCVGYSSDGTPVGIE